MEAGPPLLSWNKYTHDTSSLLVMSVLFFSFSYIHKRGVGYIHGSGLYVCECACVVSFFFLIIGVVCFMRIPTWGSLRWFCFSISSSQSFFSLERKATSFFSHSSVTSIKVCNQILLLSLDLASLYGGGFCLFFCCWQ